MSSTRTNSKEPAVSEPGSITQEHSEQSGAENCFPKVTAFHSGLKFGPSSSKLSLPIPWSKQEHSNFLRGLRMYGTDNWNGVAAVVGTRSVVDVEEYGRNYLSKTSKMPVMGGRKQTQTMTQETASAPAAVKLLSNEPSAGTASSQMLTTTETARATTDSSAPVVQAIQTSSTEKRESSQPQPQLPTQADALPQTQAQVRAPPSTAQTAEQTHNIQAPPRRIKARALFDRIRQSAAGGEYESQYAAHAQYLHFMLALVAQYYHTAASFAKLPPVPVTSGCADSGPVYYPLTEQAIATVDPLIATAVASVMCRHVPASSSSSPSASSSMRGPVHTRPDTRPHSASSAAPNMAPPFPGAIPTYNSNSSSSSSSSGHNSSNTFTNPPSALNAGMKRKLEAEPSTGTGTGPAPADANADGFYSLSKTGTVRVSQYIQDAQRQRHMQYQEYRQQVNQQNQRDFQLQQLQQQQRAKQQSQQQGQPFSLHNDAVGVSHTSSVGTSNQMALGFHSGGYHQQQQPHQRQLVAGSSSSSSAPYSRAQAQSTVEASSLAAAELLASLAKAEPPPVEEGDR